VTSWDFSVAERPTVAGAPYMPSIGGALKVRYALVGLALAATSTLGNGLVIVNLQAIAGAYGIDAASIGWLVAAFVGMGAAANIFMIKGRQQFALEPLLFGSLALYIMAATVEIVFPSFATALVARGLNGMATSTVVATSVYYFLQAFDGQAKALSIPLCIALAQLGTPLARLLPVEPLTVGSSAALHLVVLGIALFQFLLVWSNRLPPTYTVKVFEPLDSVAALLLVPACIMIAGVLALGRTHWWTDAPWLGWLAIGAIGLGTAALMIESGRSRPVVDIAWLTRRDIGVFLLIALVERVALAEQTVSSIGLLGIAGLGNDQLHTLYCWVVAAMVTGIAVMVLTLRAQTIPFQILAALGAIMAGALLDTGSNALTRPDQMIASQSLIGFGTTLFVGPALLFFVGRFLERGPEAYVTTILLFGVTQNLGSVAGTALLSSVQYMSQQHALATFLGQVRATAISAPPSAPEAVATLADAYRQAAVIGYLDSFWVVAALAGVAAVTVMIALATAPTAPRQTDKGKSG
jgi:hypothetical protein